MTKRIQTFSILSLAAAVSLPAFAEPVTYVLDGSHTYSPVLLWSFRLFNSAIAFRRHHRHGGV